MTDRLKQEPVYLSDLVSKVTIPTVTVLALGKTPTELYDSIRFQEKLVSLLERMGPNLTITCGVQNPNVKQKGVFKVGCFTDPDTDKLLSSRSLFLAGLRLTVSPTGRVSVLGPQYATHNEVTLT